MLYAPRCTSCDAFGSNPSAEASKVQYLGSVDQGMKNRASVTFRLRDSVTVTDINFATHGPPT